MNKAVASSSKVFVILKALLVSYIISAILLLILALIVFKVDPPSGVVSAGIIITYIVSSVVGGFITGKSAVQRRFIWGMLMGVSYFFVILIVSSVLSMSVLGNIGSSVSILLMCSLGGMIGGMIS